MRHGRRCRLSPSSFFLRPTATLVLLKLPRLTVLTVEREPFTWCLPSRFVPLKLYSGTVRPEFPA